jgi:uncharacterized membrane protein YphA (DoxX/SURF4 family)
MIDPVISLTIRLALALLFTAAAWHKLSNHVRFVATVRAYRLLPEWLLSLAAWLFPAVELGIAIGLLYPPATEATVFAAVLLLSLYSFAIWQNLTPDGRQIDCGCFASSAKVPPSGWLVARNVVLMLATCVLVMPNRARALIWVDGLTVFAALFTLWVLWNAGQRLASTGPALRRLGAAR